MTAIGLIACGLLTWSLYHYWGHRIWHAYMEQGLTGGALRDEVLHHVEFDDGGGHDDGHIGFPRKLWALTGVCVLVFGLLAGPGAALWFGIGMFGGMGVDDQLHRAMHRGALRWAWFVAWHRAHHRSHRRNFAMATGAIWDVVFGTAAGQDGGNHR